MYKKLFKNMFDLVIALVITVCILPILLIIAIAIALNDGLPIIYKQKRLGLNGKGFEIFKFRTMVKNADKLGPLKTEAGDRRVTKIGSKLRSLSLDELPQIINVIRGDMSFIGPRPDIYIEYDKLTDEEKLRASIRPGITGFAQVNGRSSLTQEQRMSFDLDYVNNCSFLLDLRILIKTVVKVLRKDNINSSLEKKESEVK